jgi:hypothetical protein
MMQVLGGCKKLENFLHLAEIRRSIGVYCIECQVCAMQGTHQYKPGYTKQQVICLGNFLTLLFFFSSVDFWRHSCIEWNTVCTRFLFKLVKTNAVYKDALRELGLFEMMISYLRQIASVLKEKSAHENGS